MQKTSHTHWTTLRLTEVYAAWVKAGQDTVDRRTVLPIIGTTKPAEFLQSLTTAWQQHRAPIITSQPFESNLNFDGIAPQSGAIVGFLTSGTSQIVPKVVWKTWSQLNSEAECLISSFDLNIDSQILSLVSPTHIFGFLYSVLTPAMVGAKVTLRSDWQEYLSIVDPPTGKYDVIVTVPPLWSLVRPWIPLLGTHTVLSSSAPMGSVRISHARELGSLDPKLRVFDIVGSTETGGIGFLDACKAGNTHTPFDGVRLEVSDDFCCTVTSPFTDYRPVNTADLIEIIDGSGEFKYLGRADRTIKMGGKRVDLQAIEAGLKTCGLDAPVICHFEEDSDQAKGGRIVAFIEAATQDLSDFLNVFRTTFEDLPVPQEFVFVDKFPRGPAGKVAKASLFQKRSQSNYEISR